MMISINGINPIIFHIKNEAIEPTKAIAQFFLCKAYTPAIIEGTLKTSNTAKTIHKTVKAVQSAQYRSLHTTAIAIPTPITPRKLIDPMIILITPAIVGRAVLFIKKPPI